MYEITKFKRKTNSDIKHEFKKTKIKQKHNPLEETQTQPQGDTKIVKNTNLSQRFGKNKTLESKLIKKTQRKTIERPRRVRDDKMPLKLMQHKSIKGQRGL